MGELYCGLRGGMISVYDIYNQKIKMNLQGHSSIITAMSIYRKNDVPCALASASADGKIKLFVLVQLISKGIFQKLIHYLFRQILLI